jgi:hypothetical protein
VAFLLLISTTETGSLSATRHCSSYLKTASEPELQEAEAKAKESGEKPAMPVMEDEDMTFVDEGAAALKDVVALMEVLHSPMPGFFGLYVWDRRMRKREKRRFGDES